MSIAARLPVLIAALLICSATSVSAQCLGCTDARRSHATRAELEALAVKAEEEASASAGQPDLQRARRAEAMRIRDRLQQGDFLPGDRIVLSVDRDTALTGTFTVRAGGTLSLPDLPDASLSGILRSELEDHLTRHLARYLREPSVSASSLLRLAVIGEVQRPGFYPVSADVPLSDIVMTAGGPTHTADLGRMTVRRGNVELLSTADLRLAVAGGLTVDQLNLRSGDEISVGVRPRTNWSLLLTSVTALVGVVSTTIALSN